MISIREFVALIGKVINKLFIYIWPPYPELTMRNIDISLAIAIDDCIDQVYHIRIDRADGWTPIISLVEVTEWRAWNEFGLQINNWLSGLNSICNKCEVFDASSESMFKNIIKHKVIDIQLITLKEAFNPFGIKIIFESDYIIITPNSCGTTIETLSFNKSDNLKVYNELGEVEFLSIHVLSKNPITRYPEDSRIF